MANGSATKDMLMHGRGNLRDDDGGTVVLMMIDNSSKSRVWMA